MYIYIKCRPLQKHFIHKEPVVKEKPVPLFVVLFLFEEPFS